MFLDDAPVHKFYDKIRAEESRRCVLDSASAGLYHLGMNSLTYRIHSTIGDKRKELQVSNTSGQWFTPKQQDKKESKCIYAKSNHKNSMY